MSSDESLMTTPPAPTVRKRNHRKDKGRVLWRKPRRIMVMCVRELLTILALVLLSGLNGCLHAVATPEERRTGIDLVGSAESSAPIRVGVSTRSEVIRSLGEPKDVSSDGRAIAYSYNPIVARSGFVFLGGPCGLCGYYPFEDRTKEDLWL